MYDTNKTFIFKFICFFVLAILSYKMYKIGQGLYKNIYQLQTIIFILLGGLEFIDYKIYR